MNMKYCIAVFHKHGYRYKQKHRQCWLRLVALKQQVEKFLSLTPKVPFSYTVSYAEISWKNRLWKKTGIWHSYLQRSYSTLNGMHGTISIMVIFLVVVEIEVSKHDLFSSKKMKAQKLFGVRRTLKFMTFTGGTRTKVTFYPVLSRQTWSFSNEVGQWQKYWIQTNWTSTLYLLHLRMWHIKLKSFFRTGIDVVDRLFTSRINGDFRCILGRFFVS